MQISPYSPHLALRLLIILTLLMLLLVMAGCAGEREAPLAQRGVLDLSGWDFARDGAANLDGEWEFYWGQLWAPEDFRDPARRPEITGFISLPAVWNDFEIDGEKLPADGYATYRLQLKIGPGEKTPALRVADVWSAYRLWVDGRLLAQSGTVGASAATENPRQLLSISSFYPGSDVLELILQVSNHHYRDGGMRSSIRFGPEVVLQTDQNRIWGFSILIVGCLLVMGIYHLALYGSRRQDAAPLYFGLYCLLWVWMVLDYRTSDWLSQQLLPNTSWSLLFRSGTLCYGVSLVLLLLFAQALYPEETSRRLLRLLKWLVAALSILLLLVPSRMLSHGVAVYHLLDLLVFAYFLIVLVRAMRLRRQGAIIIFSGFMLLCLTAINDILNDLRFILTTDMASAGLFCFVLAQAIALLQRFSGSFADVEQLSGKLEEKNIALSRLDRLKDEFLANTSHELRTPLNGIIGMAESVLAGNAGALPKKAADSLDMVVASGRRLSNLVNDILDFSKLKNRDLELRRTAVDVRALTELVLAVSAPLARGKQLKLSNRIPRDLPLVYGDEDRLQQILFNLIGNAIKFTESGEVTVSACSGNPKVEIAVADSGIGIPEDQFEQIFQSFEQADAAADRRFGGSGLGLPITRQLIELHGGQIQVKSNLGQGSTFRFTLPISQGGERQSAGLDAGSAVPGEVAFLQARVHAPSVETEVAPDVPATYGQYRVLVVDDEPINLQVVINHLAADGLQVRTAASGAQALEQIAEDGPPDLLLLDIMMPGMTGYQVCQQLRQEYSAQELPIIMLTASNRLTDLVAGFEVGANDYLTKPFFGKELCARLHSHLKLREAYLTLEENQRLKKELVHRQQTELDLRVTQRRLSGLLDSVDEALLALNQSGEISYCNRPGEKLLASAADELLGCSIWSLLVADAEDCLRPLFENPPGPESGELQTRSYPQIAVKVASGKTISIDLLVTPLEFEDELLYVLILRRPSPQLGDDSRSSDSSLPVIEELNRNRGRLQLLEESLSGMLPKSTAQLPDFVKKMRLIDSALEQVGLSLGTDRDSRRLCAVEVMSLAIDYWCETTGTGKAELASESKIWKVYTNLDGWERTQTLDRYLDSKTLPTNPRWNKVIATADFVLAACDRSSDARARLEASLARFRFHS